MKPSHQPSPDYSIAAASPAESTIGQAPLVIRPPERTLPTAEQIPTHTSTAYGAGTTAVHGSVAYTQPTEARPVTVTSVDQPQPDQPGWRMPRPRDPLPIEGERQGDTTPPAVPPVDGSEALLGPDDNGEDLQITDDRPISIAPFEGERVPANEEATGMLRDWNTTVRATRERLASFTDTTYDDKGNIIERTLRVECKSPNGTALATVRTVDGHTDVEMTFDDIRDMDPMGHTFFSGLAEPHTNNPSHHLPPDATPALVQADWDAAAAMDDNPTPGSSTQEDQAEVVARYQSGTPTESEQFAREIGTTYSQVGPGKQAFLTDVLERSVPVSVSVSGALNDVASRRVATSIDAARGDETATIPGDAESGRAASMTLEHLTAFATAHGTDLASLATAPITMEARDFGTEATIAVRVGAVDSQTLGYLSTDFTRPNNETDAVQALQQRGLLPTSPEETDITAAFALHSELVENILGGTTTGQIRLTVLSTDNGHRLRIDHAAKTVNRDGTPEFDDELMSARAGIDEARIGRNLLAQLLRQRRHRNE